MKLVILAGGYGSRLKEITSILPKPMVEIGEKPILWHIMKIYSQYGINEFIICLGYKGNIIKDYFLNYDSINQDFTIDLCSKDIKFHSKHNENNWKVTLVDTGLDTLKGARLKKIEEYLEDDVNLLTYGDGLADIDINELIKQHTNSNKIITISGVRPLSRFGELKIEGDNLVSFEEKAQVSTGLINVGYMVFNKELLNYLINDENCDLEYGVFEKISKEGKMGVYKHKGQWACIDTERDLQNLNKMWKEGKAFWKKW